MAINIVFCPIFYRCARSAQDVTTNALSAQVMLLDLPPYSVLSNTGVDGYDNHGVGGFTGSDDTLVSGIDFGTT